MNWYKKAQEMQEKIASFDFDNTLFMSEWDNKENDFTRDKNGQIIGKPNQSIISIMKQHANAGWKIIIISSRYEEFKQEIANFIKEYGLPVSEIYCTNGENKIRTLRTLNVNKHFDDDQEEINLIEQDPNIIGIKV